MNELTHTLLSRFQNLKTELAATIVRLEEHGKAPTYATVLNAQPKEIAKAVGKP